MPQSQPESNGPRAVYAWLGQQVLAIVIASCLSTYVSTKVLDTRVTALESQAKDVQENLKEIATSVNKMAVSFAELSQFVKDEIRNESTRVGSK